MIHTVFQPENIIEKKYHVHANTTTPKPPATKVVVGISKRIVDKTNVLVNAQKSPKWHVSHGFKRHHLAQIYVSANQ